MFTCIAQGKPRSQAYTHVTRDAQLFKKAPDNWQLPLGLCILCHAWCTTCDISRAYVANTCVYNDAGAGNMQAPHAHSLSVLVHSRQHLETAQGRVGTGACMLQLGHQPTGPMQHLMCEKKGLGPGPSWASGPYWPMSPATHWGFDKQEIAHMSSKQRLPHVILGVLEQHASSDPC